MSIAKPTKGFEPKEHAFAFVDALGFSEAISKGPLLAVYQRWRSLLGMTHCTLFGHDFDMRALFVSDTIALIPPKDADLRTALIGVIATVSEMLQFTVAAPDWESFRLRGAVSVGEVLADLVHDFEITIGNRGHEFQIPRMPLILGKPVVESYKWEQSQKWIGASIDPDSWYRLKTDASALVDELIARNYCIPWDIPTESGLIQSLAINYVTAQNAEHMLKNLAWASDEVWSPETAQQRSYRAKYMAAFQFVRHVVGQERFFPRREELC